MRIETLELNSTYNMPSKGTCPLHGCERNDMHKLPGCNCILCEQCVLTWLQGENEANRTSANLFCPLCASSCAATQVYAMSKQFINQILAQQVNIQVAKRQFFTSPRCPNQNGCGVPLLIKVRGVSFNCPACNSLACGACYSLMVNNVCSNNNCKKNPKEQLNSVLKTATVKNTGAGVPIMNMRACPKCQDIIYHFGGCKFCPCPRCNSQYFCMRCLSFGYESCGKHDSSSCPMAPIQAFSK